MGLSGLRRYALPLLALPALAACAGDTGPCQVTQAAAFDLGLQSGMIFVPATIHNAEVQVLLDTGAEASAVTSSLVTKFGLLDDPRDSTVMSGVGGIATPRNDALIDQFAFAGRSFSTDHLAVIDDLKLSDEQPSVGAILGADALHYFDLDIDEPHKRLTVYRVSGRCTGAFLPWRQPYAAIPIDQTWGGRLRLPVSIDGVALTALLDTGASRTFVDSSAAAKIGVSDKALQNEPSAKGFGAAGVDFNSTAHRFDKLVVGPDTFAHPYLTVLDRTLRDADMLLGEDYLQTRHVWISYHSGQFFVAPPEPAKQAGALGQP